MCRSSHPTAELPDEIPAGSGVGAGVGTTAGPSGFGSIVGRRVGVWRCAAFDRAPTSERCSTDGGRSMRLANSRPYECPLACLLPAIVLAHWLAVSKLWQSFRTVAGPCSAAGNGVDHNWACFSLLADMIDKRTAKADDPVGNRGTRTMANPEMPLRREPASATFVRAWHPAVMLPCRERVR
jgi:hypothetical protein